MFDRHYHTTIHEDHYMEAAKILGNKLESISTAEIKSKNRVDISLEEYERLKEENASLKHSNHAMRLILTRIGVPEDLIERIIPASVKFAYCNDALSFKKHCEVHFTIDTL